VGTQLKILSRNEAALVVDYIGEKIEIPIDATDFADLVWVLP
jgi:hypothetical protein